MLLFYKMCVQNEQQRRLLKCQAQLYLNDSLSPQCKLLPVVSKGIVCANNWGALMRMHSESVQISLLGYLVAFCTVKVWKREQNCPIISSQDAVQEACFKCWQAFYSRSVCQHVLYTFNTTLFHIHIVFSMARLNHLLFLFKMSVISISQHLLSASASELFIFSSILPVLI